MIKDPVVIAAMTAMIAIVVIVIRNHIKGNPRRDELVKTPTQPIRLCVDCKYYSPNAFSTDPENAICRHPIIYRLSAKTSKITGKAIEVLIPIGYNMCAVHRAISDPSENYCGVPGNWFEAKQ